jgi:hypothetical protein
MKTKLLKKIRKRFTWSYGKKTKQWLLVDHKTKETFFIDKSYAQKYLKSKKKPPCGWAEMKFRILKFEILKPYYISPAKIIMYKAVNSLLKNNFRKKKKKQDGNTNKI